MEGGDGSDEPAASQAGEAKGDVPVKDGTSLFVRRFVQGAPWR